MIIQFCIIIFCSMLYSQFSTNNLNGFGDNMDVLSTFSESMGGMWMNNANTNSWDPLLASSLYNTDFTTITASSSIQGAKSSTYNVNNHSINYIGFSFPVKNNIGIGLGLSPYTRTDYIFNEGPYIIDGTEFSPPLYSTNADTISGGISRLDLAISKGLSFSNLAISLGFKWSVLFGNQDISTETTLNEISYDQSGDMILEYVGKVKSESYNHIKGHLYEMDGRVVMQKNSFSFLFSLINNFEINRSELNNRFAYLDKKYELNQVKLDRLGIGYMYNKSDNFGVAIEGHFKNSIQYPKEIILFNNYSPSEYSFHNGLFKKINNSKIGVWNSINLSAGYSYKLIKFTDKNLNDISISFGTGITFNQFKNKIDISLTIGAKQNIVETIGDDNYYKLNVTILSGDKWFEKRRRK